jgi:hypothetical protein
VAHGNYAISGLCMWLIESDGSEHVRVRGTSEDGSAVVYMLMFLLTYSLILPRNECIV